MTCPQCGQGMYLNGAYWQCPQGHLVPKGSSVPDGVTLLPLAAK
jgi:hypothetical protein